MVWQPDYITRVEAKTFMDESTTVHDADIDVAITAASRAIDEHCNRQFGKTAAAETRLYTAWPDLDRCKWVVDVDDFMTTTGLVVTIGGVAATVFTKEPVNAAAEGKPWTRLVFDPATASVVPTGAEYEVSFTVNPLGWTAVPVPVAQAARLQTSRMFSRRQSPYGVAGSPDQGSELRLLARLDPDVAVSLRGYVRPRAVA